MPCLSCGTLIPQGTAYSFSEGLACTQCFSRNDREHILRMRGNASQWHFYREAYEILRYSCYVVPDLNDQNAEKFNALTQIYVQKPCILTDTHRLNRLDYLSIAKDSQLKNVNMFSVSVIIRGDITLENSNVTTLYIDPDYTDNGEINITLINSAITNIYTYGSPSPYKLQLHYHYQVPPRIYVDSGNVTSIHLKGVTQDKVDLSGINNTDVYIENSVTSLEIGYINDLHITESVINLRTPLISFARLERSNVTTSEMTSIRTQELVDSAIVRIPLESCTLCHQTISNNQTSIRVKDQPVHRRCFEQNSYRYNSFVTLGSKVKLPTFGVELELFNTEEEDDNYNSVIYDLVVHGFKRCSDSTVTDELKSPILRSDKWFLECRDNLNNALPYITSECGTHIHVGTNYETQRFFQHRAGVFEALTEHMDENEKYTRLLWGREFNQWAKSHVDPDDRYSWLNLESNYRTIEYRLPVFQSFEQYRKLVYFVRLFNLYLFKICEDESQKSRTYNSKVEKKILEYYIQFENKLHTKKEK